MKTVLFALMFCLVSPAYAACRKALAVGVDVSASVDRHEYQLQLGGLAAALQHPSVAAALFSLPENPVDLLVFEWGEAKYQRIILPWTEIDSPETLARVVMLLRRASDLPGQALSQESAENYHINRMRTDPSTAIGSAMLFGFELLKTRACWTRTLDLSGDGVSNTGPEPRDVIERIKGTGVTINALPVISGAGTISADGNYAPARLERYFRNEVILGPSAFVVPAQGFKDFKRAMTKKLLRELEGPVLSRLNLSP
jgi:hypothetical protein